ncbi:SDR family oxidoreductase [Methylobacterium sp. D48H]
MDSKFWGAYWIARSVQLRPGGSLTFVSGYMSERLQAAAPLQGAINAALESLARGLALELAPTRVNSVSLGLIETPLWSRMPEKDRAAMYANAVCSWQPRRLLPARPFASIVAAQSADAIRARDMSASKS